MARIELHSHLLPGVDDGPATMDESLALARAIARDGSVLAVATTHVRHDFVTDVTELPERCAELRARVTAAGIPLAVATGGELGHDMVGRLSQGELDLLALGPPHARWLLLESPFDGIGDEFRAAAGELRDRGFGVLIAHPERAPGVLEGAASSLWGELEAGSLLQVSAGSLLGEHGSEPRHAALRLLAGGLAAVIASDAHGAARPPGLTRVLSDAATIEVSLQPPSRMIDTRPASLFDRGIRVEDGGWASPARSRRALAAR